MPQNAQISNAVIGSPTPPPHSHKWSFETGIYYHMFRFDQLQIHPPWPEGQPEVGAGPDQDEERGLLRHRLGGVPEGAGCRLPGTPHLQRTRPHPRAVHGDQWFISVFFCYVTIRFLCRSLWFLLYMFRSPSLYIFCILVAMHIFVTFPVF